MLVFSHRGESDNNIENTMSAFFDAVFKKSDGIETDIRKTKDNILVLHHDKTIDRLSNKKGKISNYSYEELLNIDFKGERIVTLDEFLKYFSNKKIKLFLEIKEENIEKEVIKLINKYKAKNVIVISFKYNVLKNIYDIDNNICLGYLIHNITNKDISKIKEINGKYIIALSSLINEDDVIICKNNNIKIIAWGLICNEEIKRMNHLGIYGIMYNDYDRAEKYM